jgi:hypothetical protein
MLVKPLLFDRAMNLLHVECKSSIKVRENSLTQQLIFQMNCKVPGGQTVRNDLSPSSVIKPQPHFVDSCQKIETTGCRE